MAPSLTFRRQHILENEARDVIYRPDGSISLILWGSTGPVAMPLWHANPRCSCSIRTPVEPNRWITHRKPNRHSMCKHALCLPGAQLLRCTCHIGMVTTLNNCPAANPLSQSVAVAAVYGDLPLLVAAAGEIDIKQVPP